jgi:hypothetical protein
VRGQLAGRAATHVAEIGDCLRDPGPGRLVHHPAGLKLVDSKVSTTGVMIGTREPAGEIVTGSFALG